MDPIKPAAAGAPTAATALSTTIERPALETKPLVEPILATKPAAPIENGDDTVMVKPLRRFREDLHDPLTEKYPGCEPYGVKRSRAVELRAGGLVEYVSADDEEADAAAAAKRAAEAARKRFEVGRPKTKTT